MCDTMNLGILDGGCEEVIGFNDETNNKHTVAEAHCVGGSSLGQYGDDGPLETIRVPMLGFKTQDGNKHEFLLPEPVFRALVAEIAMVQLGYIMEDEDAS